MLRRKRNRFAGEGAERGIQFHAAALGSRGLGAEGGGCGAQGTARETGPGSAGGILAVVDAAV